MPTFRRVFGLSVAVASVVAITSCISCSSSRAPMRTTLHVDETRSSSSSPSELVLPTTMCRGLWVADVYVNGAGPYPMIVDTGASSTTISERVKREAGIKWYTGTVRIGDFEVENAKMRPREIQHLADALGTPIDGILGHDIFRAVTVVYDYSNNQLRVSTERLDDSMDHVVRTKPNNPRPYVRAGIAYHDGRDGEFWLLIDTGKGDAISIKPFDDLDFQSPPVDTGGVTKIHGFYTDRSARLDGDMLIGSLRLDEPVIDSSVSTNLLGFKALRHCVLSVDQRSGLARLAPITGEAIASPPVRGIGVALRAVGEDITFAKLFEGSTAGKAGIKEGDVLLAVNGVPIAENRCDPDRDIIGDRPVATLTVRRGGDVFDVDVEVAVLVE